MLGMNIKRIPKIPEDQIAPIAAELLELIQLQMEEIYLSRDEIARLNNQKPRPKIRPSSLEKPLNKGVTKKKKNVEKNPKPKRWKFMRQFA